MKTTTLDRTEDSQSTLPVDAFVIDTETHTLNGRVIEMAVLRYGDVAELASVSVERFNPLVPIDFDAMAIHHITNNDVMYKPAYTTLQLPMTDAYYIGHNVKYDLDCIKLSAVDVSGVRRICTYALAKIAFPYFKTYKQSVLCYALASTPSELNYIQSIASNAHTAQYDVLMCHWLLGKICEKLTNFGLPIDLEALHQLSNSQFESKFKG